MPDPGTPPPHPFEDPARYNPNDPTYWAGFCEHWRSSQLLNQAIVDLVGDGELRPLCMEKVFLLLCRPEPGPPPQSLELLITRAAHDAALFTIFEHRRGLLLAVAQRVLRNSSGDAEDAAQEAFLTLTKRAWRLRGSLEGFLARIAKNKAVDMLRYSPPTDSLDAEDWMPTMVVDGDPSSNPEAAAVRAEEAREARACIVRGLACLSRRDAHMLVRHDLDDDRKPNLETLGREIGISYAAAKKGHGRARRRLRAQLERIKCSAEHRSQKCQEVSNGVAERAVPARGARYVGRRRATVIYRST